MTKLGPKNRVARYHIPLGNSLLFRPLPKSRPRPQLDIAYDLGEGRALRFSAREALGVPEQTLLLAILELAGEQFASEGQVLVIRQADGLHCHGGLWSGLYPDGGASALPALMLHTTWKELNHRCGSKHSGGSADAMRKESLRRLCEVVVWEEFDRRRVVQQSFLVAWTIGDDHRIHLAINHRLASAFLGDQFATVLMNERLRLGSDLPMLVHAFFSTCVRPGNWLTVKPDTLYARVWAPGEASQGESTARWRMGALRSAMAAIGGLSGWKVEWAAERGVWNIFRPSGRPVGEMPSVLVRHAEASFPQRAKLEIPMQDKHLQQYDASGLFNRS